MLDTMTRRPRRRRHDARHAQRIRHLQYQSRRNRARASRRRCSSSAAPGPRQQPFGWQGRYFEYRSDLDLAAAGAAAASADLHVGLEPGIGGLRRPQPRVARACRDDAAARRQGGAALSRRGAPSRIGTRRRTMCSSASASMSPTPTSRRWPISKRAGAGRSAAVPSRRTRRSRPRSRSSAITAATCVSANGCSRNTASRIASPWAASSSAAPTRWCRRSPPSPARCGPGVLDAVSAFQLGERTDRSIALFGEKVLPRIREPRSSLSGAIPRDRIGGAPPKDERFGEAAGVAGDRTAFDTADGPAGAIKTGDRAPLVCITRASASIATPPIV